MKIILTILLALSFTSISLKADWRCMGHLGRFTYLIDFASIGDTLIVAQKNIIDHHIMYSTNGGETFDTLASINSTEILLQESWMALNARGIEVAENGDIFLHGFDRFPKVVKFNIHKLGWYESISKNDYDFDVGQDFISDLTIEGRALASYGHFSKRTIYYTYDFWQTLDSISFEDERFSTAQYAEFINDSIIVGLFVNRGNNLYEYNYLNVNTKEVKKIWTFNSESIYMAHRVNEFLIYAVGRKSNRIGDQGYDIIYRSRDGGKSWEKQLFGEFGPSVFGLNDVLFKDEMNGIAVGIYGKAHITNNGGEDWFHTDYSANYCEGHISGPWRSKPFWFDTIPYIGGTIDEYFYKYEGDYFKFDYDSIKATRLIHPKRISDTSYGSPFFSWDKVEGAEYYQLQISEDSTFSLWNDYELDVKTTNLNYPYNGLLPEETYYWRVLTAKGSQVRKSETRKIISPKPHLTLDLPTILNCGTEPDTSTIAKDIPLNWTSVENAERYSLRVYQDGEQVIDTVLLHTTFTLQDRERGSASYIEVKPLIVDNNIITDSTWYSADCYIRVDFTPPKHDIENCAVVKVAEDSLTWESDLKSLDSLGDYKYQLEFYKDSIGGIKLDTFRDYYSNKLPFDDAYGKSNFKRHKRFWWRVRILPNKAQFPRLAKSDWSDYCSFWSGAPPISVEQADNDISIITLDGSIVVEYSNEIQSMSLIDITGRIVAESQTNTINSIAVSAGNYFLVINGTEYKKVVVQ